MKHRVKEMVNSAARSVAAVIAYGAIIASATINAGCSQTPAARLYEAEAALDAAVTGLNTAHGAGALSAAEEAKLAPYVDAASAAIASLQAAVAANDQDGIGLALRAFDAAMQAFAAARGQANPATTPVR